MKYPGYLIKRGETNRAIVKAIQQQLIAMGCGPLAIDGDYQDRTIRAVKLFQSRTTDQNGNLLEPDGKVGAITWASLFGVVSVPQIETTKKGLLTRALEIATTQVGVSEIGGANCGPEVEKYLASVGLPKGNSWCMSFVYWCFQQAATELHVKNPLVKTGGVLKGWNDATCKKIVAAEAVNNPSLIKPGQIFIIDHGGGLGHTGIVKSVNGGFLTTIEGNTNNTQSREGIGVFELTSRKIKNINKGFLQY